MNICKTCLSRFGCHPSFETDGVENCSFYEADKNAVPKQIDWEQRRYEIAKDLFISSYRLADSSYKSALDINYAVELADALIEHLKKKVSYDRRKKYRRGC